MGLLSIKNLSIDFVTEVGTVTAVNNISLDVNRGEVVAIVGESGSGKSVTSLSILQLLPSPPAKYSSGEILFSETDNDTVDLLKLSPKKIQALRGNKIAMIFQEPMTSLNPVLTCGTQVMEAIELHRKFKTTDAKEETIKLFSKVKLPDPEAIFDRYPHQLSGGQKQRVMIAVAMSCDPLLLICDEPTTALDVTVQKTILQLIRELQQEKNMGVIFITHDLGVVAEIADRAVVLYKGQIVEHGNVRDIFNDPQHPYTKSLLMCRPVLHNKGERLPVVSDFMDEGQKERANQIQYENKEKKNLSNKNDETLIKVENLNVWFPSVKTFFGKTINYTKAVHDVSFNVYRGETLGLVGESGCGKTTLGRALLRLIEPISGKIIFNGMNLLASKADELKKMRKDIQIVFQDPYSSLNPRLTIGSAIAEALKVHHVVVDAKERKEKVMELLKKVNLSTSHFERYPHEFSGGQRQRIVIARALALNPSFVVFDESVSALDVSVQAQVLNLINDLKTEFGFTVIFISHDLAVVRYISDRIMVMNKGQIEEMGPAEDIYHHPSTVYTKKLIAAIPGI
ncbi:MAG: ABC transporter ATP-binding protein [Bacteroidetes bacterium]|nr:ABC transporter ATP-binding protein [Bacteroidota bacterium]